MLKKSICRLAALVMLLPVSCVDDNLSEPLNDQVIKEIPTLDEQQASVEASVEDLKALQAELEQYDMTLADAAKALDGHVDMLKKGVSVEKGTLAALDLQKSLAVCIGTVQAELMINDRMDEKIGSRLAELESGVKAWLGEPFGFYYPVVVAQVKVNAVVAGFDATIDNQLLYVDALLSDIEAGLRKDEKPEELTSLAASVKKNDTEAKELSSELSSLASEMETGYRTALTAAVSNPSEFDAEELKTLNATAEVEDVDNSLQGLMIRVQECETTLQSIIERLGALEENIEGLLGMIQSVTFMSPTSSDKVSAHYSLDPSELTEEGYMNRLPSESIQLSYVVRPAAASAALTDQNIWNDGLKVLGYYAGRIEQAAVSNQNLIGFEISAVEADQLSGVVTVTVANTLSEDFYFKRTGAKMALSVTTGKNDLTSKFVEVVPVDESGTVYVESLSLSTDYVEVDCDLTHQLKVVITPDEPTDATLIWTSSADNIATVSGNGLVTGKAVGEADITVTTGSTDEWGRKLSKTCRVKVVPNIKLDAAQYVEVGGTMTINVKSPDYIDKKYIKWSSSNTYHATVDEDGVVTGAVSTYNAAEKVYDNVTITCTIGDYMPTVLTHTMPVVMTQPKGVRFASLGDGVEQKTIKVGEKNFSLAGEILPEAAASNFRLFYQAAGGGNDAVASINYSTGAVTAKAPGSVTFMARVLENEGKYYYPVGTEVWRWITINVEPYWVESVTLPETIKLEPQQTAILTPEFTSDVSGVQPTYKDLVWTSSNSDYVSVDAETGEITAMKSGSAVITATTSNEWSVPSGVDQKTASCTVVVDEPSAPMNIGDYYYTDGTWSATRDDSKTVVGVIFAKASAATSDPAMMKDFPSCTHGLVVSLVEYADQDPGTVSTYQGHGNFEDLGYQASLIVDTSKPLGYYNTLARDAYCKKYSTETTLFNRENGILATQEKNVKRSEASSTWYIPSYSEMSLMRANLSKVNDAIETANGTKIGTGQYWSSTIYGVWYEKGQSYDHHKYTYNIGSGGWNGTVYSSGTYPVRVVLAF